MKTPSKKTTLHPLSETDINQKADALTAHLLSEESDDDKGGDEKEDKPEKKEKSKKPEKKEKSEEGGDKKPAPKKPEAPKPEGEEELPEPDAEPEFDHEGDEGDQGLGGGAPAPEAGAPEIPGEPGALPGEQGAEMGEEPTEENAKKQALALAFGHQVDEIQDSSYDDNTFEVDGAEYKVLTDEEADAEVATDISQSLWAFNASFLCSFMGLPGEAEEMLETFCGAKCEDANDTIEAMIGDRMPEFVQQAVSADGRGHFLGRYDGEEHEETLGGITYYIYRTN